MEDYSGVPQRQGGPIRNWIDPIRIYNPGKPAGRLVFLWGLAIYPGAVMFVLLSTVIIVIETLARGANVSDYLGIVVYVFMLVWVTAVVCICRRRLMDLGRSPAWVWLAILPVVNLIFFGYLLIKAGRAASHEAAA